MGNYLGKNSRSLRRRERRPFGTHTAAPVLWPRAVTPGVAANSGPSIIDVSSTVRTVQQRRRAASPWSWGRIIIASTPCFCVGILGTNIAVLLDCSKSSRQCSLSYLLTYLLTPGKKKREYVVSESKRVSSYLLLTKKKRRLLLLSLLLHQSAKPGTGPTNRSGTGKAGGVRRDVGTICN